jgi:predicted PurR-regulated permease PerM
MSRSVELHPLAIALGVLTGTILSGIVGALLAVPFIAFLNTTISALRHPVPAPALEPPGDDDPDPPGEPKAAPERSPDV